MFVGIFSIAVDGGAATTETTEYDVLGVEADIDPLFLALSGESPVVALLGIGLLHRMDVDVLTLWLPNLVSP